MATNGNGVKDDQMFVIIVGAGKMGLALTKLLMGEGHEVLLVEKDKTRYLELDTEFGGSIFHGDAGESDILKQIGANRANVMVAVTGDDETNLVVCQMSKIMYMTPRTIARISNPKNEDIFSALGVDHVINTTKLVNALIEKEVDPGMLVPILDLKGGKVEIVETEISSNSPVVGKAIKDIKFPEECLMVSILRDNEVVFPHGNTIIQQEDVVMILISKEKKGELRDLL